MCSSLSNYNCHGMQAYREEQLRWLDIIVSIAEIIGTVLLRMALPVRNLMNHNVILAEAALNIPLLMVMEDATQGNQQIHLIALAMKHHIFSGHRSAMLPRVDQF